MKQILIVEDDHILSQMYQTLLTNHGYGVSTVSDGLQGLTLALQIHPDLILLDLQLPEMDGLSIMHALRADPWGKGAKIIIFTNLDTSNQILTRVTADQPAYYLIKSNTAPQQVLEKVQSVIDS